MQIRSIRLSAAFENYTIADKDSDLFLQPLSKVNIFVGSNNSGKSRFLRTLALQEQFNVYTDDPALDVLHARLELVLHHLETFLHGFDLEATESMSLKDLGQMRLILSNPKNTGNDSYAFLRTKLRDWADIRQLGNFVAGKSGQHRMTSEHVHTGAQVIRESSVQALEILADIPEHSPASTPKKVYVPTLRGLRPVGDVDLYEERTLQDYFQPTTTATPQIFTGRTLYKRLTDLLLGSNQERKLIQTYQRFISRTLFEGNDVALIPNQQSKVVVVKIGKEKEREIHHLGDGIQSAIILSFLPLVMPEPTLFFIEEPEMYLHPGLQRKILNFFADASHPHTFFMTTHSNHFLDITIDIKDVSIFTFRKVFENEDHDELTAQFALEALDARNRSSLELLGVRNSSVFLVNATIWVEGITDRWYLRRMLNSYIEFLHETDESALNLEEDVHYSFVEYGGSNITHWSFLDCEEHPIEIDRLCSRAIVVIDQDGEKKMARKEALAEVLGERLIVLPAREIENLLPFDLIRTVILDYENDPERAIADLPYELYRDKYLGRFIEEKVLKKTFKRQGGYKSESGALKNKVNFCEKAVPHIIYANLPESTQNVVTKIYDFVCSQNS